MLSPFLLFAAASHQLAGRQANNISALSFLQAARKPDTVADDYIFIACYGGLLDPVVPNWAKVGECCGKAPTSGECPVIPGVCREYLAEWSTADDNILEIVQVLCPAYCQATSYRASWCTLPSPNFMLCYGLGVDPKVIDFERLGECCVGREKEYHCYRLTTYCEAYYEDGKENEYGNEETETACETYCSFLGKKTKKAEWCPPALSGGAIAGSVIAVVVVVVGGGIAGVVVFFFIIRKKPDEYSG
jgi:hypothetical protein